MFIRRKIDYSVFNLDAIIISVYITAELAIHIEICVFTNDQILSQCFINMHIHCSMHCGNSSLCDYGLHWNISIYGLTEEQKMG